MNLPESRPGKSLIRGDSNFNLFAVGRCLINGWKLSRDNNHVIVSKDGLEIRFDIVIWTKKEAFFCCMRNRGKATLETTAAATKGGT